MRVRILSIRNISTATRDGLSRVVRPHHHMGVVERRQISYWQQQGWAHDRDGFNGSYQTPHGVFRGYIHQRGGHNFDFYIFSPPDALRNHSHWTCFQSRGEGWYSVHMSRPPVDISSGIITIERLINEAFEN